MSGHVVAIVLGGGGNPVVKSDSDLVRPVSSGVDAAVTTNKDDIGICRKE